jgi:hypothetical protein
MFCFLFFLNLVTSGWKLLKQHFTNDEVTARHVRLREILRQRCQRLSEKHNRTIDLETMVMDFKGSPVLMEKNCLQSIQAVLNIDQQYYPETVAHLLIINVPWYVKATFAIMKPFLNPLMVKRMEIYGEKDTHQGLLKYIDDSVIPVEFGGKNEHFSWEAPNNKISPDP